MIWFNRIASLSKGKVGKNVGKRRNAEGFIVKDGSWTLCFVCQSFVDVTDKLKVYISLGVREKLKLYRSELEFWCVCVRACVHVCVCARTCVHACVWVRRARVCVRGGVILGTGKKGQQIVLSNQSLQQHSISSNPTVIETVLYESCTVNVAVFIFFLFQPEWIQAKKNSTVRNCSPFLGHHQMNMSKEFMTNGLIIMTRY